METTPPGSPAGSSAFPAPVGWYPGAPVTVDDALRDGRLLRSPRWGILDAVGGLLGAYVLVVLAAGALLVLAPGAASGVTLLVGVVVSWIALGGWPLLVTRLRGNGPVVDLGLRIDRRDAAWGAAGGVVALGLGLLVGVLTVALSGEFDSAAGEAARDLADSSQRPALVVFAILVLFGAPVVEELAFRGLLFAALAKRGLPPWLTVTITTVAFAAFHFEPRRLPVLLVIGAVLGWLRWRTRAMGASIVAHGVNNLPGAIGLLTLG